MKLIALECPKCNAQQQEQAARKEAERQNRSSSGWGSLLKAGGALIALAAFVNTIKDD